MIFRTQLKKKYLWKVLLEIMLDRAVGNREDRLPLMQEF